MAMPDSVAYPIHFGSLQLFVSLNTLETLSFPQIDLPARLGSLMKASLRSAK